MAQHIKANIKTVNTIPQKKRKTDNLHYVFLDSIFYNKILFKVLFKLFIVIIRYSEFTADWAVVAVLPLTDSMGVFSNPLLLALYSALLSIFSYVKVPVTIRFFSFSIFLSMPVPLRRVLVLTWCRILFSLCRCRFVQ